MTKKLFLIFTVVMVFITGTTCYAMIHRAKKSIRQKNIKIKIQTPSDTPVPLKISEDPSVIEPENNIKNCPFDKPGTGNASNTVLDAKSLTKGQKYYMDITANSDKNILLIGKDPLYSNFDTMVIASLNIKGKYIRLVDLPRDIYIDYTDEILNKLKSAAKEFYREKGNRKMNAAPVIGRKIQYCPEKERFPGKPDISFLADIIHEIFNISVDDYISVETDGFRELVDYFGGIEIDVPIYMYYEDPLQNLYIHLEPGLQTLNGTQAEGFVRFRQGYNREGKLVNYPRANNTFLFLKAFYKQHITIKNLSKIGKVAEIVRKNTITSVDSVDDIYQYALMVRKILTDDYAVETMEIECTDTKEIDGALYDMIRAR